MKLVALALLLLQDPQEIEKLAKNVTDYPAKFRLAKIGRPALDALFAQIDSKDDVFAFETKSAIRWIAIYASQKPEEHAATAEALARFVAKERPAVARAYAAEMFGELGAKEGVKTLAALMDDDVTRDAALEALAQIRDASAGEALKARLSSGPELKRRVVRAIGRRRDPSLTPALAEALKDVPDAAADALAESGDPKAADALVEAKRIDALLKLASTSRVSCAALARAYKQADDAKRPALLLALGRTGDREALDVLRTAAQSSLTDVHVAALRGLLAVADVTGDPALYEEALAQATDAPTLSRGLAGAGRLGTKAPVPAIAKALAHADADVVRAAAAALRDLPGEAATKALVDALSGPARDLAIDALGARRSAEAVTALCAIAEKGEIAAVKALGKIGDPAGADTLATIVDKSDPPLRTAAIEALLAIADASRRSALYVRVLELGGPAYQARALAGLALVPDMSALPAVEAALRGAEGELKDAGLKCLVAIAEAHPKRDEARKLLRRAFDEGLAGVEDKLRALGERVEIVARDGRIEDWWVVGPFAAPDEAMWAESLPPEKNPDPSKAVEHGGSAHAWRTLRGGGENGVVNLDAALKPNEDVVAYAFAEVVVRKERAAVLKCGSDDGIIVWVNGEKVHEVLKPRGLKVDEDTVKLRLREGANAILVKVCEKGGGWEFHARLEDEEGRPLKFKVR